MNREARSLGERELSHLCVSSVKNELARHLPFMDWLPSLDHLAVATLYRNQSIRLARAEVQPRAVGLGKRSLAPDTADGDPVRHRAHALLHS
jgi:hypothetical protein